MMIDDDRGDIGFYKVAANIPTSEQLREMSYRRICTEIEQLPENSARRGILEREKRRRDRDESASVNAVENSTAEPPAESAKPVHNPWLFSFYEIAKGVAILVVSALIIHVINSYFGTSV